MPTPEPSAPPPPAHSGFAAILRTAMLAAILLLPVAMLMGAFDRFAAPWTKTSADRDRTGSAALENAARYVRSLPARTDAVALAAEATPEGHWRFVSKAGEIVTAGTPEEIRRAVAILYPEVKGNVRPILYVTEETVVRQAAAIKGLPAGTELFVVAGSESYRLVRQAEGAGERLFAEIRPHLVVEMTDRRLFREGVWQLERPLAKAGVRVLALEPGGPSILSAAPRIDPASRRPLVDVIDPASLVAAAMPAVSGQTLLLTGRIERDQLYIRPSSGGERSLPLKDLFKAAELADVNLVVLHTGATPRQPGGRNWLWQRVEVAGLEEAQQRSRLADLLNGLGSQNRRVVAMALPVGGRALLDVMPAAELPGSLPTRAVSNFFSGIVADLTGRVTASGVKANLRSAERQQEFDQRLLPGVPSAVQFAYLALMVVGLLGVPVSRAWWLRVWPPEVAAEYAGRTGFWAARTMRAVAYVLIFLPLTAPFAAPHSLASQMWDGAMIPVRWWRRLAGRSAQRTPPPARSEPAAPHPATPTSSNRDWPVLEAPRRRLPNR